MEAKNITEDSVVIAFSIDELAFLCNAINEALEAVEEWEFETRTGQMRTRALELHHELCGILGRARPL